MSGKMEGKFDIAGMGGFAVGRPSGDGIVVLEPALLSFRYSVNR